MSGGKLGTQPRDETEYLVSCNHDVDIRTYKIKDVGEFRKTTLFKVFVGSVIDGATEVAENKVKAKKEARIGDRDRAVKVLSSIRDKVSQKNRMFRIKIGYKSGCNIKYTWLLKVEYLLNGSTDLYEILNLSS